VALTRAKDRVYLSSADTRMRFGQVTQQERSRFIDDLPEDELDLGHTMAPAKHGASTGRDRSVVEETAEYAPGDRVVHPTFGGGEVLDVADTSIGQSCTILFDNEAEPRTVVARFARMTKANQRV